MVLKVLLLVLLLRVMLLKCFRCSVVSADAVGIVAVADVVVSADAVGNVAVADVAVGVVVSGEVTMYVRVYDYFFCDTLDAA